MINLNLGGFCTLLLWVWREEQSAGFRKNQPQPVVPLSTSPGIVQSNTALFGLAAAALPALPPAIDQNDIKFVTTLLDSAQSYCDLMEMEGTSDRIKRFRGRLQFPASFFYGDLETELRTLREAMEDDAKKCQLHYYKKDRAALLGSIKTDWPHTCVNFKSARADINSATDCYAIGQYTSAVFHLMRVAEFGLRALARERSVTLPKKQSLEWADWQTVIEGIGVKVDAIAGKRRGPARGAALEFYRGALGSLEGFKDAYRNDVMHARKSYDEGQALSVLTHVREFMERLADKISETPKAIRWGLK